MHRRIGLSGTPAVVGFVVGFIQLKRSLAKPPGLERSRGLLLVLVTIILSLGHAVEVYCRVLDGDELGFE